MLLRDSISFTFGADDLGGSIRRNERHRHSTLNGKEKNGGRFFNASGLDLEGAATLSARRGTEEDVFFFHKERLPHRPEFGSPDDFRKTRAAPGSVEVRSGKTTWNETKREEKRLFPSVIRRLPIVHFSSFLICSRHFMSYHITFGILQNSVISSGPDRRSRCRIQIQVQRFKGSSLK